jgi:KDO2-lipid IV(A) lauroyltransferase
MKKAIHGIEYCLIRLLAAWVNALPDTCALRLGATIGALARRMLPKRVAVIRENLRICGLQSGHDSDNERFIDRCFAHIGVTAVEALREYSKAELKRKISPDMSSVLESARQLGNGGLLMSAHFGNWELLASYVSGLGYPVGVLVKRQSNPLVDRFICSLRRHHGVKVIYTDTGMRELIESVRKNSFIAVLADQYGGADAESVRFFGVETLVPSGPAALVLKYKLPLMIGFMCRAKDGSNRIDFSVKTDWEGCDRHDVAQHYTTKLEEAVRKSPEMWLWTHRKFKNVSSYGGGR